MPHFDFTVVISWLKSQLGANIGFAILDGENAILNPNNVKVFKNFFADCTAKKLKPIIVGKVAHIERLKTRLPEVVFPDDLLYFFLHGDNKNCPDDAFIIELYTRMKTSGIASTIYTQDRYANRHTWGPKAKPTMISYNLFPTRPRRKTDPKTIVYNPDLPLVIASDLKHKEMFKTT